jgi:hypothetical protein
MRLTRGSVSGSRLRSGLATRLAAITSAQFDDVYLVDAGRHTLDDDATAESDDEHVLRLRPRHTASGDNQYSPLNRGSNPGCPSTLRAIHWCAVRVRRPARATRHWRCGPRCNRAHGLRADVEWRSDQQLERWLRREEPAGAGHGHRGDATTTRLSGTSATTRASRARRSRRPRPGWRLRNAARNSTKPAASEPDGPDRVPGVHARAGRSGVAGIAREHAHGEWIGHADRKVIGSSNKPRTARSSARMKRSPDVVHQAACCGSRVSSRR